jgi:Sulfotransferase family
MDHGASTELMGPHPTIPRVLYIGGLGRSGTTLLERLLGQIDGVQTLGETVHLWTRGVLRNETCGCSLPFHDCPFWDAVGRTAFGGWSNVDVPHVLAMRRRVDRLRRVPGMLAHPGAEVQAYSALFRDVYLAAQQASRARLIVDSSKHPSMVYCLRSQPDLDVRVVHLVRDPRAVAYSWAKTVERPEAGDEQKFMSKYSAARAASLWNVENLAVSGLSRLDVPVLRVSYEAMVEQPASTVRKLLEFAGMPADVRIPIDGHRVTLEPTHSVSGNPLRFRTGALDIRRDDEWQASLAPRDRAVVSAITAPLRAVYRTGRASREHGH